MVRKRLDDQLGSVFIVEVNGKHYKFADCYTFAELANLPANIHDAVLMTKDGQFIRLAVVGDEGDQDPYGVRKGWYVAFFVEREVAVKTRESWGILRVQPPDPIKF